MKKIPAFFMLCLLLTACSSNESQDEPDYEMPIAVYEMLYEEDDPENFNLSMDFFKNNTATIVLYHNEESAIPVEEGKVEEVKTVSFRIEDTDVKGEVQVSTMNTIPLLKTIDDKAIASVAMQEKLKNEEPITVILKFDENTEESVNLQYRTPEKPSE